MITNIEALQSVIGINYPFNDNMYSKAFIDASILPGCLNLNPTDEYVSANAKTVDLCVAGLILTVILSPDIKEGGYSVTQADRQALLTLRSQLLAKYGISSGTGFVNDASNVW